MAHQLSSSGFSCKAIALNLFFHPQYAPQSPVHFNFESFKVEFLKTAYLAAVAITVSNNSPIV